MNDEWAPKERVYKAIILHKLQNSKKRKEKSGAS
jgi:hypothetical protein